MGLYLAQAIITGNFSWRGFGKSLLMGAISGAVSGGISHIFSVSSFWGTVGVGALTGGVNGGITAIITGQNFIKGVVKGAVIGGAIAGVSWGVSRLFMSEGQSIDVKDESIEQMNNTGTPVEHSSAKVKEIINSEFSSDTDYSIYAIKKGNKLPKYLERKGYSFDGKDLFNSEGEKVLAVATPFNKGKYMRYVFAPKAFSSYEQLVKTTGHELLHGAFFNAGYNPMKITLFNTDTHHAIIAEWEQQFIKIRGWQNIYINKIPHYNLNEIRKVHAYFNENHDGMMKIMKRFLRKK